MLADSGSISSPDHELLGRFELPEDQSVALAQKPGLSSADQVDSIFQKIEENRESRISKEEIMAVHQEFHTNGYGRLPESQLQASTVVPLPEVMCCDTGTEKQNAESNVETMVTKVGGDGWSAEDDNAAAVGGDSFDGDGVKDNGDGPAIVGDGGDVKLSFLMWVSWNFEIIWLLLKRGMTLVKAGALALCFLSFCFGKQHSFSSKDTLYLRIALVCGLLAFFLAPRHVPDAHATLRDQDMHEIAVLTLLMGVLAVMVIALDEEFRVPVLVSCLVVIPIGRGLYEA